METRRTMLGPRRHRILAFLFAMPIAILGGLIGLGGAEFRLPVLVGPLRYAAHKAVPLNLAVSLTTIVASLLIRSRTLSFVSLAPLWPAMFAMIGGAVVAAFFGASLAGRLSNEQLERVILLLLVGTGSALIVEAFLPQDVPGLLPPVMIWWIVAGVAFGLVIGLVSTLLGVAGGELIIPTLVFAYGADIKIAGTASLIISLPTVTVGVLRYARHGAYTSREAWTNTVVPMGIGSVIGAIVGGWLVGFIPTDVLKLGLGIMLIGSAFRMFCHTRSSH